MPQPTAADRKVFRSQARILKALANESRLMIVDRLSRGECSAGDLTRLVGTDQTTVSKHLALLKRVGLVRDRKRGTWSDYELVCDCVTHLIDCVEEGMAEGGGARPAGQASSCRAG